MTCLKDLFPADLNAAVAGLRLMLRQLLSQDLQLLHQVSLVFWNRETFCLLGELGWGQSLGRANGTALVFHLRLVAVLNGQRRTVRMKRNLVDLTLQSLYETSAN